ncbi:MAG: hypothetical protein GY800_01370 [Planctomycetes bacterium]|nr:hypothetical protein [Planctomycetota bacterium]
MFYLLLILFLIAFAISFFVNQTVVHSVRMLLEEKDLLEAVDQIDNTAFSIRYQEITAELTRYGYLHECFFLSHTLSTVDGSLQCAAWWSEKEQTWCLLYFTPHQETIDFVSLYAGNTSLTTASSKDALLLPKPAGAAVQAFPRLDLEGLRQQHLAARTQLAQQKWVSLRRRKNELLPEIHNSLKQHARYITSLPLWQWRGVYWYFIRRHLRANKAIVVDKEIFPSSIDQASISATRDFQSPEQASPSAETQFFTLLLRISQAILYWAVALFVLNYKLEQDKLYGMFTWIESPNYQPLLPFLGGVCSVLVWLFTRHLMVGKPFLSREERPSQLLLKSTRMVSLFGWLFILLVSGNYLFDNPPASVAEEHEVAVLRIYEPPRQSKPYKYYLELKSWRGREHETLSSIHGSEAHALAEAGQARIFIGTDWFGQIRVLRAVAVEE